MEQQPQAAQKPQGHLRGDIFAQLTSNSQAVHSLLRAIGRPAATGEECEFGTVDAVTMMKTPRKAHVHCSPPGTQLL